MKREQNNIVRRLSMALVLLMTIGIASSFAQDTRQKKKVTTTTTQKQTSTKKQPTTSTRKQPTTSTKKGNPSEKKVPVTNSDNSSSKNDINTKPAPASMLDCGDIDMICNKAMELVNSEQYDKALVGLHRAKELPELRNCSDIYKIDNTISTIQGIQTGEIISVHVGNVSFNMVRVEGGTFTMGATSEQGSDANDDEKPTHSVTLSNYYIGETEVTQELWQEVMGSNPSGFKGNRHPVENVSWDDCLDFIRRLNQRTGKNFRLPTEAEWEFAARGGRKSYGHKYAGGSSVDDVAWHKYNSGKTTHPVTQKRANELGLYDMSGNVDEWCSDWYSTYSSSFQTNPTGPSSGSFRVLRGGCWTTSERSCRVSIRGNILPSSRFNFNGLRLAL